MPKLDPYEQEQSKIQATDTKFLKRKARLDKSWNEVGTEIGI
jgi:hypothetical protein